MIRLSEIEIALSLTMDDAEGVLRKITIKLFLLCSQCLFGES